MLSALASAVTAVLAKAGLPTGGFTPCAHDRVAWAVPDPAAQRAAHAARLPAGLVWETAWLDLGGNPSR